MNRVQRSRAKGSKLPPNTLVVTRGTPFGNYEAKPGMTQDEQVEAFRAWWVKPEQAKKRQDFIWACENLDIENIACWCKLDVVCHGDILIDYWHRHNEVVKQVSAVLECAA